MKNDELANMSLEVLWKLFPIKLVAHDEVWSEWFEDEKSLLNSLINESIISIEHIGSTAIPNILAKPIVDILIEISEETPIDEIAKTLLDNGYIIMSQGERQISLNKGYTPNGYADRVFHIHLRYLGDDDEVFFRDYLIAHPEVAKEYEELKLTCIKEHSFDRDAYTEMKGEFILKYTTIAKTK